MVSILIDVGIDSIDPDPEQPRAFFDPQALRDLGCSIRDGGLIQPIRVREHPDNPFRFRIVTGERRWRAAKEAGLKSIQCINVDEKADYEELQLIENIHREDLTPLEEARAYQRLMQKNKMTQAELAQKLHRPRVTVTENLAINNLPSHMIERLERDNPEIPKSQLILIAKEKNRRLQEQLWEAALDGRLTVDAARAMSKGQPISAVPTRRALRALENAFKQIDGLEVISDDQIAPINAMLEKLQKLISSKQAEAA